MKGEESKARRTSAQWKEEERRGEGCMRGIVKNGTRVHTVTDVLISR